MRPQDPTAGRARGFRRRESASDEPLSSASQQAAAAASARRAAERPSPGGATDAGGALVEEGLGDGRTDALMLRRDAWRLRGGVGSCGRGGTAGTALAPGGLAIPMGSWRWGRAWWRTPSLLLGGSAIATAAAKRPGEPSPSRSALRFAAAVRGASLRRRVAGAVCRRRGTLPTRAALGGSALGARRPTPTPSPPFGPRRPPRAPRGAARATSRASPAPRWDERRCDFVGMIGAGDFVDMAQRSEAEEAAAAEG